LNGLLCRMVYPCEGTKNREERDRLEQEARDLPVRAVCRRAPRPGRAVQQGALPDRCGGRSARPVGLG
jgi:hypothetical protein